jgi:hypothetical protein
VSNNLNMPEQVSSLSEGRKEDEKEKDVNKM